MELARGNRASSHQKANLNCIQDEFDHHHYHHHHHQAHLLIKLPDSKVMRVISRSVLVTIILFSLPWVGSYLNGLGYESSHGLTQIESLELLLRDLSNEGLLRKGDKALVTSSENVERIIATVLSLFNENEIKLVLESNIERLVSVGYDEKFDFAYVSASRDTKFVDCVMKIGGVVVVQSENGAIYVEKLSNYRIEYVYKYESTIIAMRKVGLVDYEEFVDSSTKRRQLNQLPLEAKKKVVLGDLEDVLLEPPRKMYLPESNKRKIKFLSELLGDSMRSYSRKVFINVGSTETEEKIDTLKWFRDSYPRGNQDFEMYNIEIRIEEDLQVGVVDVSEWMKENMKEKDYVVMKVDAAVAEAMIERRSIYLVDELFLECKNNRRRAYWECLALYGRLRDEGVAVHQWWG